MSEGEKQTENFIEGKYIFKGTGILFYPGFRGGNGVVENLTTYRENPVFYCIGVIQEKPVSNLGIVTNEIIPYAVYVFNKLSPTTKISETLMSRSIDVAAEGAKIIPRRRA